METSPALDLRTRLNTLEWPALLARLEDEGHAVTEPVLSPQECAALAALFAEDARFRSRIAMERYRFGAGEYAYFAHPLPPVVTALREALYAGLVPLANSWSERLGTPRRPGATYPPTHAAFLDRCHAAGQRRPTPLLLRYEAGDYNCLHRDLYGPCAFPLQATVFLNRPGEDYAGGEFLLVENRPRQQSRGTALLPEQGAAVLFPSAERPAAGKRGVLRVGVRHGVSTVTRGLRYTLGIVFHDAE
jgi:hypothetical protein